jgi:enamine deaminase RidA (YjgF/YER057c/UK114 family)
VSLPPAVEKIETNGCSITLRRVEGPLATELFLSCRPPAELAEPGLQGEAIYRAIVALLDAEGASFASVVSETLFLRSLQSDLEPVRKARQTALADCGTSAPRTATTWIEQPPLDEQARLELAVQAVLPREGALSTRIVSATPTCDCAECRASYGLVVELGEETRLYASGLYGRGADADEQTRAMFEGADALLRQAGMEFRDVVRTWIHLREMERDYPGLNRARRAFFEARGIDPPPASTGIGGGTVPANHDLCLGLYAVRSAAATAGRGVMTTPTLNEAMLYGSDFVRGMRIGEANKVALHVSGTASIDESGETVHLGDLEAQVDRMLLNIAGLLEGQGARFRDVVSAITYLKRPEDAARLRAKLREAGFEGFPNVLVAAEVCRPELLCEAEVLAALPGTAHTGTGREIRSADERPAGS